MLAIDTTTRREGDFALDTDGSLLEDDGLETVVFLSLFTDAQADLEEVDDGADRRGWWFDAYDQLGGNGSTGSKLWLIIERGIVTTATLQEVEAEAARALEWMKTAGAASKLEVECTRIGDEHAADLKVRVYRPTDPASPYTFTWELRFAIQ